MKTVGIGLLVAVCAPIFAADDSIQRGEGRQHRHSARRTWIRRATLAASCATSLLFDTVTTQRQTAAGAVERNPLLADSQGHPQWGRTIGIKAGVCGASVLLQETHAFGAWRDRTFDWSWTAGNMATTSLYAWAGFHNLTLQTGGLHPGAAQSQSIPDH